MEVVKDNLEEKHTDKNGKEIPSWQIEVQNKLIAARQKGKEIRFKELADHYNEKLKAMMSMYFSAYSSDEEENVVTFNILNAEWQDLTNKANATQKIIELKHNAFALNVRDVENSEEFKNRNKVDEEVAETPKEDEPNEML